MSLRRGDLVERGAPVQESARTIAIEARYWASKTPASGTLPHDRDARAHAVDASAARTPPLARLVATISRAALAAVDPNDDHKTRCAMLYVDALLRWCPARDDDDGDDGDDDDDDAAARNTTTMTTTTPHTATQTDTHRLTHRHTDTQRQTQTRRRRRRR